MQQTLVTGYYGTQSTSLTSLLTCHHISSYHFMQNCNYCVICISERLAKNCKGNLSLFLSTLCRLFIVFNSSNPSWKINILHKLKSSLENGYFDHENTICKFPRQTRWLKLNTESYCIFKMCGQHQVGLSLSYQVCIVHCLCLSIE